MVRKSASERGAICFHAAADPFGVAVTGLGTAAFERPSTGPLRQPVCGRRGRGQILLITRSLSSALLSSLVALFGLLNVGGHTKKNPPPPRECILITLTAHTGSLVSPTKNVTSQSSGMEARNFMSSARPVLFSNIDMSGSSIKADVEATGSGIFGASAELGLKLDAVIGEK